MVGATSGESLQLKHDDVLTSVSILLWSSADKRGLTEINAEEAWRIADRVMVTARVTSLSPVDLDEALVLAGLGSSNLDADRWRRDSETLMADPSLGGVLIARNSGGSVCGLLRYWIVSAGEARPSLQVERLVAFDLMHPQSVADALIAEATRLARLRDCESLRLVRPLGAPSETAALVLASGVADLHSVF
jgi:hypothetical protein